LGCGIDGTKVFILKGIKSIFGKNLITIAGVGKTFYFNILRSFAGGDVHSLDHFSSPRAILNPDEVFDRSKG
jgi:hypothetical protein